MNETERQARRYALVLMGAGVFVLIWIAFAVLTSCG